MAVRDVAIIMRFAHILIGGGEAFFSPVRGGEAFFCMGQGRGQQFFSPPNVALIRANNVINAISLSFESRSTLE